ncbi:hypothetical protein GGR50DRAFT_702024 [Xylaria sp. CBS 124048]|nr:hypothetical protein GGR50DRAFT_702024 [Xylaria sp. CBS 124048]
MTAPLDHLVSQVPGFIGEHHNKRRRDSDTFSDFFNWERYLAEGPSNPGTRSSGSVVSSEPGLTSGPSEEDGAPSPGPAFDAYDKDVIKQIKQHDDHLTIPEREIRPKGGPPYPSNIQLDSVPSPTGPSSGNILFLGSPVSPPMFDLPVEDSHPINRGKRTRPLENREKVAGMRKRGACHRCRARKVTCDEGTPCSTCMKDAAKFPHTGCDDLAEQMCFRQYPTFAFSEIENITRADVLPRRKDSEDSRESSSLEFGVFFQSPNSTPLCIKVDGSPCHETGEIKYRLCTSEPLLDEDIVRWASRHMTRKTDGGFQSTLDQLVETCLDRNLPHSDLLRKIRNLRCFYEVWRQETFLWTEGTSQLECLPEEIRWTLRGVAAKRMKGIEADVLKDLAERPKSSSSKSSSDGLALWVCTMQLVLLYRDLRDIIGFLPGTLNHGDIRRKAESLMNYAVVICELHFGKKKKKPTLANEQESQLSVQFNRVQALEAEFLRKVYQQDQRTDRVLSALLATKNLKCPPSRPKMSPPSKRQRQ